MSARAGFLGIGSNVGDRPGHLRAAVAGLEQHGVEVTAVSRAYLTAPVGLVREQRDFLNAALAIRTGLEPLELLDLCKAIEVERGRVFAGPRHGPRPLDVDLLLLEGVELNDERLILPHPALAERRFVLEPLVEIAPDLVLADGSRAADRLAALGDQRVEVAGPLAALEDDPDEGFQESGRAAGA